jgi:hypothetical protein
MFEHAQVSSFFGWYFSVLALAVFGCGNGSSPSSESGTPVSAEQFANAMAATCGELAPCCPKVGVVFNNARCQLIMGGLAKVLIAEGQGMGRVYDAQAAGDCVAAHRATGAACVTGPATSVAGQSCNNIYIGTTAPGKPCENNNDCARNVGGRVSCDGWIVVGESTKYVCVVHKQGKVGDPCAISSKPAPEKYDCRKQDGLWCNGQECDRLPMIGERCSNEGCVQGLACVNSLCAACTRNEDCGSDLCTNGTCTTPARVNDDLVLYCGG